MWAASRSCIRRPRGGGASPNARGGLVPNALALILPQNLCHTSACDSAVHGLQIFVCGVSQKASFTITLKTSKHMTNERGGGGWSVQVTTLSLCFLTLGYLPRMY